MSLVPSSDDDAVVLAWTMLVVRQTGYRRAEKHCGDGSLYKVIPTQLPLGYFVAKKEKAGEAPA